MIFRLRQTVLLTLACTLLFCSAQATELIYMPNNPSFGGNPQNGPVLMNSANAQNHYVAPYDNRSGTLLSPLDTFNQRLQAMILDRLAASITGSVFDHNGNLIPGTINTANFSISIFDIGNGMLSITTTDRLTGASTSFEIRNAP